MRAGRRTLFRSFTRSLIKSIRKLAYTVNVIVFIVFSLMQPLNVCTNVMDQGRGPKYKWKENDEADDDDFIERQFWINRIL